MRKPDDDQSAGGAIAVYFNGGRIHEEQAQRPRTSAMLAEHFFAAFPQVEGVSFSHAWGGVIDTCTRFCPFFGTAYGGRLAYAAGYTGLGVGATRFAAQVLLDLGSGPYLVKITFEWRRRLVMLAHQSLCFPLLPRVALGPWRG